MLPSPLEDFEELPGTVNEHVERSKLLIKEIGLTILANFFQHLLFMSPLCILFVNVYERHQILENSIGALPEEHEAYNFLLILTATCVPGLFIATVLQFLSYYCFNRFFHPFKDILSGPKRVQIEMPEL